MSPINASIPVLYSARNCPFCMRARMALAVSGVVVELREVDLKNKPAALLEISPKASVPVLVLQDGKVIDQSLDIVHFALRHDDPLNWLRFEAPQAEVAALISQNDERFIKALIRLKYPERLANESNDIDWDKEAKDFLNVLEEKLSQRRYLASDNTSLPDIAIVPFVLQYSEKKPGVINEKDYKKLSFWLEGYKHSDLYRHTMVEYPVWQPGTAPQIFPQ